jgi:hypothetical protein
VLLTVMLFGLYLLLLWFVARYAAQDRHGQHR